MYARAGSGHEQEQAHDGQGDPDEIHQPARSIQRYRQRAGKFQGHRYAQGNRANRHIVEKVHQAQRQAIEKDVTQARDGPLRPPGLEDAQKQQAGEDQS
jgi:hypothetical protein